MGYINKFKFCYTKKKPSKKRRTLDEKNARELIPVHDREFSKFIRMSAAGENGLITCPTCGNIYHWKEMDCSHYISRDNKAVRWNEKNVIAQCQAENRFHSGNIWKIRKALISMYGEEAVNNVELLAEGKAKLDRFWLLIKINEYREINKKIKKEKGL